MQFLTTTTESYISLFFTLALMLFLLYFMIYRPQKKQEKKDAAMRAALEIGDQVVTIGGIVGRVVAIKEDTFVLETGSDRVKIRFTKNAISSVGLRVNYVRAFAKDYGNNFRQMEIHLEIENTNSSAAYFNQENFVPMLGNSRYGGEFTFTGLHKWNGSRYVQDVQLKAGETQTISYSCK